jgi:Flp pilus assembly protein TadG
MGNLNESLSYLWASLGARMARLHGTLRDKDRGASAVELAIITAVILVIAGVILAAIRAFVTAQANTIGGG